VNPHRALWQRFARALTGNATATLSGGLETEGAALPLSIFDRAPDPVSAMAAAAARFPSESIMRIGR
jgi:hypothetical protein